jgi:hypothetical protein
MNDDVAKTELSTESACERFEAAWKEGRGPRIEEYLGGRSVEDRSPAARELLLQLAIIDLQYRWKMAAAAADSDAVAPQETDPLPARPLLEDYLVRYPGLAPAHELPASVIADEYWARRQWGDRPGHDEYLRRFPHASGLPEMLADVDRQLDPDDVGRPATEMAAHRQIGTSEAARILPSLDAEPKTRPPAD